MSDETIANEVETEAPPLPLCTHCFTPVTEDTDFCPECGCPLGRTTGIDPIKSIWARGYFYREAAAGTSRTGVVIAMWLIFGPQLLLIPYGIYDYLVWGGSDVGMWLFTLPFAIFSAIILWRTTMNYRRVVDEQHEPMT